MQDSFSPGQSQPELLRLAARLTGRDPDQLRQAIQSGQLEAVLSGLPGGRGQQAMQLLQDPQALRRMLESPQAQALLRSLMGR